MSNNFSNSPFPQKRPKEITVLRTGYVMQHIISPPIQGVGPRRFSMATPRSMIRLAYERISYTKQEQNSIPECWVQGHLAQPRRTYALCIQMVTLGHSMLPTDSPAKTSPGKIENSKQSTSCTWKNWPQEARALSQPLVVLRDAYLQVSHVAEQSLYCWVPFFKVWLRTYANHRDRTVEAC